jgi:hypothetical protein
VAIRITKVTDIIEEPHRVPRLRDHQDGGEGTHSAEPHQVVNTPPAKELGIPLRFRNAQRLSLDIHSLGH